ncbi:hypothetical protein [Succinivibrio sp.]|uniref:TraG/VirB4 family ATPase n=1 Tax=Succinivibrio sp. TaxID=2053619 RepID=UPI0038663571
MAQYVVFMLTIGFVITFLIAALCLRVLLLKDKKAVKKNAFTDLIDYALLGPDNIVILKNGALMKVYKIEAQCISFEDPLLIKKKQQSVCDAIKEVNSSFIINFDVIRTKDNDYINPDSTYHGPVRAKELFCKRMDTLKHDACYKNEYYLCVTSLAGTLDAQTLTSLFTKNSNNETDTSISDLLEAFKTQTDRVLQRISTSFELRECTYKNFTGIKSHETISFLRECICFNHTPLMLPKQDFYLDMVLSDSDFESGMFPKIADKYIGVVAVEGFPNSSEFCILNALSELDFEYRYSSRYIVFDRLKSNLHLEKYRRFWAQKKRGLFSMFSESPVTENTDAIEQEQNVSEAKSELNKNAKIFGTYTGCIIIYDRKLYELKRKAKQAAKLILSLGFGARIESVNATDAYLGSLPGHCTENVRRALISNEVFADFLPLNTSFKGEKYSPNTKFFGDRAPSLMTVKSFDNGISNLNLHINELANCLVLGPTGAGKSVFLGSLIPALLQYEDMHIFCFDKGYSLKKICSHIEGAHICLDERSDISLCPLYDLSNEDKFTDAFEFLVSLFEYNRYVLSIDERQEIRLALELLCKMPEYRHSLSDLLSVLTSINLKKIIEQYCKSKAENALLDGDCKTEFTNELTVFECAQLFSREKSHLYPTLKAVFNLINDSVQKHKASAIIIDEAWMMLKDEYFNKELIMWIKTLRKHNVTLIMATQSITDLSMTSNFVDILDCVQTRVYLPNSALQSAHMKKHYEKMNLNEREIYEIANGREKQDFFLHKADIFMPFRLILSDKEKELLGINKENKANDEDNNCVEALCL